MIHDDFSFNDFFCWEDPGLSLRNMEIISELRTFVKAIEQKLAELEKEPVLNKELIMQEKVILEATQKEIRNLERKTLYAELGE
jgi:hypothetical protein